MQALIPWQRVRVEGYSMTPALLPGDWLLVRHGAPVRPGAIVLARFHSRPDLTVVKRAASQTAGGWLLASDNTRLGADSRQYGAAQVLASAVWIWPAARAHEQRRRLARMRALVGHRPAVLPPLAD